MEATLSSLLMDNRSHILVQETLWPIQIAIQVYYQKLVIQFIRAPKH